MTATERAEASSRNLAKAREVRKRNAAKRRKEKEKEKARTYQAIGLTPTPTGERDRGLHVFNEVSYPSLDTLITAVAIHHGETAQLEAIGAWASMWTTKGAADASST